MDNGFWTDHTGRSYRLPTTRRRLKFKYPAHAALRAFVFHRDGYACKRCPATAETVPAAYDGKQTLWTNTKVKSKGLSHEWADFLVVDHILTLRAGGKNHPDNFQTLCETCNKRKIREDNTATKLSQSDRSI